MPAHKKRSSLLRPSREQLLILWNLSETEIPPRPDDPERYPQDDERHWYDMEHAGWHVVKERMPQSPGDGPEGKRVACLLPAVNVYQHCYAQGARQAAEAAGIALTTLLATEDGRSQEEQLRGVAQDKPDLLILNPGRAAESVAWFRALNEAGIPVIASNFLPLPASFSWFLAWTGPDDWGQSRMLARTFADLMGARGGFAIFRHAPGSSSYYARTFGVLTELRKVAPAMSCLSLEETGMEECAAYEAALRLLSREGGRLQGIVAADDSDIMKGINRAVAEIGREDIVRVAFGSTPIGLAFLQERRLHALAYQSPALDGALAVRVAVDWFSGLQVQPLRYLPKHIITPAEASAFIDPPPSVSNIDVDRLTRAVAGCDEGEVYRFFEDVYVAFVETRIVKEEEFRGLSIEVASRLLAVIKEHGIREQDIIGSYEDLYKKLFMQKSLERTLEWLAELAIDIIGSIAATRRRQTLVQKVVESIERDQAKRVSLKVLSHRFDISRVYLGQLFRKETGKSFTSYLNERRVQDAKRLLRSTTLKASEVAAMVGYSSANYFYKVFKKYAGVYPSEYAEPFRSRNGA